jgi:membrane protein implicated in regulation of membrane protease activity
MSTYNSIAWLPLCAGLTGLGLVASWFAWRRRGLGSGLRGVAWSLLPLAAYLTGSIQMFWKIGTAIGDFSAHLVLSPKVWSGVGVAALAVVLFFISAPLKRRRKQARKAAAAGETGPATETGGKRPSVSEQATSNGAGRKGRQELEPSQARQPRSAAKSEPADDDMREVEEILRRRGIN